ncbi:uncharacterized protein ATNIH1004_005957 [Aspergillus tanneri]|nr:uncharacterized protein ATNIH1004_005957 [Aspergillus tanneri]KAA8647267.1 hypothetical protein ATNIH1004_005957 [Aspergillus tanneri]
MALSVIVPLWKEADKPDGNSTSFTSPASSSGVASVLAGGLLKGRELARHAPRGYNPKQTTALWPTGLHLCTSKWKPLSKARYRHITNFGHIYGCLTQTEFIAESLEQEAWNSVTIHRQVEEAISHLERRRTSSIFSELDTCIVKGPKDTDPIGAGATFTNVPVNSSSATDPSALHQPRRQWAIVLRPENLSPLLVVQVASALFANLEKYAASAVPVLSTHWLSQSQGRNGMPVQLAWLAKETLKPDQKESSC